MPHKMCIEVVCHMGCLCISTHFILFQFSTSTASYVLYDVSYLPKLSPLSKATMYIIHFGAKATMGDLFRSPIVRDLDFFFFFAK